MKSNFRIISTTEIEFNDVELDLHNNFDFILEDLTVQEKQIILRFKKSRGDWAREVKYQTLNFVLDNCSFFKHVDAEPEFITDDQCLAGITFMDSDFREEDNALIDREEPNPSDDLIFSFESGRLIRVN